MRPRVIFLAAVAAVAATLVVAAAPAGASAPRDASAKCQVLDAKSIPFGQLEAAYRKLTMLGPKTALAKTQPQRYGVCSGTHYAFALLVVAKGVKLSYRQQVAQQDHSPIWVQRPGAQWVDEGLDSLCKLAPPSLINLWKVGARCK
jgi:hypothetical protein